MLESSCQHFDEGDSLHTALSTRHVYDVFVHATDGDCSPASVHYFTTGELFPLDSRRNAGDQSMAFLKLPYVNADNDWKAEFQANMPE